MRHLVIGRGEVGKALIEVLSARYDVSSVDKDDVVPADRFDVIHVCIPYSPTFVWIVRDYQRLYSLPWTLLIIHSSVPVGTSHKLGAVHSPIRGVHPNLAQGIRTFVKYFGGPGAEDAARIFNRLGIETSTTPNARNTEALKLWDTTQYGWNIVLEKAIKAYCDEHGLNFNLIYTHANWSYNDGYRALGRNNVLRPVLKDVPGAIGGHCVIPNAKILGGEIADFILKKDAEYQERKEAA